jgi:PAS domain S-box-containing protein
VDFWLVISAGMPWRGHVCNCSKNGQLYWVDTFVAPFIGEDGQIEKYVSIRLDITASKLAESHLQQQRQTLNNIIEGTNVGTWEWDVQTGAARFNVRWAEMVGYTLEELGETSIDTWTRLTHPDDLATCNDLLQQHFAGTLNGFESEIRMRHKQGHWVWVLDRGKVINRTPDGLPKTMAGTHMDISERHDMEDKVHSSAQLLRGAINAIDESFVIYDPDDRLVLCNENYRAVYHEVAHLIVPGARFEDIIRAGAEQGQYTALSGIAQASARCVRPLASGHHAPSRGV